MLDWQPNAQPWLIDLRSSISWIFSNLLLRTPGPSESDPLAALAIRRDERACLTVSSSLHCRIIASSSRHLTIWRISRRSRYARNASDTRQYCFPCIASWRGRWMLRRRRQDLSSRIVSGSSRDRFRACSISFRMGRTVDSARTIGASCPPTCLWNPLWTAKDADLGWIHSTRLIGGHGEENDKRITRSWDDTRLRRRVSVTR